MSLSTKSQEGVQAVHHTSSIISSFFSSSCAGPWMLTVAVAAVAMHPPLSSCNQMRAIQPQGTARAACRPRLRHVCSASCQAATSSRAQVAVVQDNARPEVPATHRRGVLQGTAREWLVGDKNTGCHLCKCLTVLCAGTGLLGTAAMTSLPPPPSTAAAPASAQQAAAASQPATSAADSCDAPAEAGCRAGAAEASTSAPAAGGCRLQAGAAARDPAFNRGCATAGPARQQIAGLIPPRQVR